ncbi:leucine-rich repeat domain-containing protein [Falsiroseomonas stagni]|nr:leucine-rich repeat domain-containing protein [Falsiroseomonas stagni]
MRDRLGEIGRASRRFRAALALSNDPAHQRYFKELLDRIDLIIANEAVGATRELGGDLSKARQDLRRLQLPELDPDLEAPTPALTALRGERGNLVEALENGVDAARALGLEPRMSGFGELQVPRAAFESTLVRIDERLRNVEDNVRGLAEATAKPTTPQTNMAVDQRGLFNLQIASLTVQVGAARLETRTGQDAAIPPESDIAALARTTEAIRDIARDVKATVEGLTGWLTPVVRFVGGLLARSAERPARSVRVLVRAIRRRLQATGPIDIAPEPPAKEGPPPDDFDLDEVKRLVLASEAPPAAWVPFIVELDLSGTQIADLSPLSGLSSLQSLDLMGTQVADVSPLSGLSSLQSLTLKSTQVADVSPLSGLSSLQSLDLEGTKVADVSPLSGLSSLRKLDLEGTQVADLTPLNGIRGLEVKQRGRTLQPPFAPPRARTR